MSRSLGEPQEAAAAFVVHQRRLHEVLTFCGNLPGVRSTNNDTEELAGYGAYGYEIRPRHRSDARREGDGECIICIWL